KLTPAQLKAQKKAEKAARRGQVVAAKSSAEAATVSNTNDSSKSSSKQRNQKQDVSAPPSTPNAKGPKKAGTAPMQAPHPPKPKGPEVPETFSYLSMAKKLPLSKADKDVHPAVLAIGQQMASFTLKDNLARLEAMLVAFQKVIASYESPSGHTFTRHFLPHCLNPQIEYLTGCRPMCFSMGNAIRMLKARIAKLVDINASEEQSKISLCQAIEQFIQERVLYAEDAIPSKAVSLIEDGETILTYGNPRLVRITLQRAWTAGRKFEVIVFDDPFDRSGQELAKILRNDGIRVHYYPSLSGISIHVRRASKVFLGGEAMFANGSLYAMAGTSDIAMAAKDADVPVVSLLETVNCDRERVSVDSLTYNEIDPDQCTTDHFRLLFDVTKDKYLSMVVTESEEANASGSTSAILAVLKKLDERT
ncbi:nagb/rpia/CoA transferase-like protein, partial [Cryphonectria parasitica EP155]